MRMIIKTLPDVQALADVMIMLCIRPAKLITLRITDSGVIGYAKNRGQPNTVREKSNENKMYYNKNRFSLSYSTS